MDLTAYPTRFDVEAKLKSIAVWPTNATMIALAQEQATIGAAAAKDEFERRTGWKPFLADASASTWYFDSVDVNGDVPLDGGFVTITGVTISGTAQVLNTNYTTEPRNAIAQGQPITRLNFLYGGGIRYGYPTTPNAIAVTGRRGFATVLPADVWQSLQEIAALMTLTSVENLQSIASISQDGFSKAFDIVGIITQKDLLTAWAKGFDIKCQQYARVVC